MSKKELKDIGYSNANEALDQISWEDNVDDFLGNYHDNTHDTAMEKGYAYSEALIASDFFDSRIKSVLGRDWLELDDDERTQRVRDRLKLKPAYPNEVWGLDDLEGDPWAFAAAQGVNVLSNFDFYMGYVNHENKIVGALFTAYDSDSYQFDIVVHPDYRGQGLGSEMMDMAIDQFEDLQEPFPDIEFYLDAINPISVAMLKKRGFRVVDQGADRVIMTRNPR